MALKWYETNNTYIWVFNVKRGLAIFVRTPQNFGIGYDLGASDEFSPLLFVKQQIAPNLSGFWGSNGAKSTHFRIGQWFVSHPHEDHVTEASMLAKEIAEQTALCPHLITCPNDATFKDKSANPDAVDFGRVLRKDNTQVVEDYRSLYAGRHAPLMSLEDSSANPCNVAGFEYGLYYVRPNRVHQLHPKIDQDYGNGLSFVVYLRHGDKSILIPGDITPEAMKEILLDSVHVQRRYSTFGSFAKDEFLPSDSNTRTTTQPSLATKLRKRGLTVLIAPHHGLQSCFSQDLLDAIAPRKPRINVISEKRITNQSVGTIHPTYQSQLGASGLQADIDGQMVTGNYSVSTKNGHHILIVFPEGKSEPRIVLRNNANELLSF